MTILRNSIAATVLILTCLFVARPSLSQNSGVPESLLAARELAALTTDSVIANVTTNLTSQVWPAVEAALRAKNPSIDAATLTELRAEFEHLQVGAIRSSMDDAVYVYARMFSAQEMREIVAFYRTPTGKKALELMPQATVELIRSLGPRMQALSVSAQQRFASILKLHGFAP